ncbi:MAG: hypothetical protein IPL52_06990 [Flavobacteriales bacterium]|nr:hypothetical protein [Flavobacteriales bacterium]
MIARTFLFFTAVVTSANALAQEQEPLRWRFTTEVIQDMLLHLNARAYHVSGRWSYGIHGAYRPSLSPGGEVKPGAGRAGEYENLHWRNWMLRAYTIGPCIRMNFKGSTGNYVEVDGFYRHWWFDRRNVRYINAEDVSFDGIRSERTDVLAVRLLWGAASEPVFKAGRNSANVLEIFGGVGYRWKSGSWLMHTGTYMGNPVYEYSGTEEATMPTLHFGIRLTRAVRRAA